MYHAGSEGLDVKMSTRSDANHHYFYGYYDNPAFSKNDRFHLTHHVPFMDRLPTPDDVNELGMIDLRDNSYTPLASTLAWNFQQGSMLQWNPACADEIIYNLWDGEAYRCQIKNIKTGAKRTLSRAVANVSPDGRYGLSINFSRVYDFRPGYGYCQQKDLWYDFTMPKEDGVFLVDMQSGENRQIIDYETLGQLYNSKNPEIADRKIVINHITFNTASNRFLFLVRYFPVAGGKWGTGLGTSDIHGNIYVLRDYTYASHYHWRDEDTLLIHADAGEGPALYELTDKSQKYKIFDRAFFDQDIHCSYSPDRRFIIGDGYPDKEGYRPLVLYNIAKAKGCLIGRFLSPPVNCVDIRSDLHTRWGHSGHLISIDSIHEGFRAVYTMDISAYMP